jgi:hypothetical protein
MMSGMCIMISHPICGISPLKRLINIDLEGQVEVKKNVPQRIAKHLEASLAERRVA